MQYKASVSNLYLLLLAKEQFINFEEVRKGAEGLIWIFSGIARTAVIKAEHRSHKKLCQSG